MAMPSPSLITPLRCHFLIQMLSLRHYYDDDASLITIEAPARLRFAAYLLPFRLFFAIIDDAAMS